LARTDQFAAAILLFFSAVSVLFATRPAETQMPLYVYAVVSGLLGVFAGVLNLLRITYMRNASGLRICSIIANAVCLAFILAHRVLLSDQLGLLQFFCAVAALIMSVIHRPRVRINGLGRFDYGAGG
jgi:hypothetical protein